MLKYKFCAFVLTCCLLLPILAPVCRALPAEQPPSVSAHAAVLMEYTSGTVVFAKNADSRLPMASTTKIMTALVACELASLNTQISVDARAVGVEGSSIYLTENETLTLEQLLYALLLESANDAAIAIAIGISGSVEAFAAEMNRKAEQLGLQNTHFTNPHGLDDEQHFTTAHDLALIARAVLQNEQIRTIVSTRKATIPHHVANSTRLLINHNKMLRYYEGCIGVKTGFTKRSGRCLVSAAEQNGVIMIAVTLNAPNDWNDHTAMLDYGFTRYESVMLCSAQEYLFPVSVVNGTDAYVMLCNRVGQSVTLPTNHGQIFATVEANSFVYAPIQEGEPMGKVVFRCDVNRDGTQEIIGEVPLLACYGVSQYKAKRSFWQWLLDLFGF